ncbi:MAG: peptide chain release factor 1 [bacterium]|nr:peptide chain release factor 1 [bacterium]
MFHKLAEVEKKFDELNRRLSDPKVIADQEAFRDYSKQHAEIADIVSKYQEYKKICADMDEAKEIISRSKDEELRELAKIELDELLARKELLEQELRILLLPKDPNDEKNIILEIRAGTGGEEAALFAGDLLRMYLKYVEMQGWKAEILDAHTTGVGGYKEVIVGIRGEKVYSQLKFESGVHRVQRVPVTEASGRIHTSTVTVAVLPEAEEIDIEIDPNDIRVDIFRSSGPGGQSVNTTDSAVRITHLPTGIVVSCQDEKSQHKNKAKALRVLRSRLLDKLQKEQQSEISQNRRLQVGSGERSEKIRTYNFPQNRITDHRIGLTLYKLDSILSGNLQEIIDQLITSAQAEELKRVA